MSVRGGLSAPGDLEAPFASLLNQALCFPVSRVLLFLGLYLVLFEDMYPVKKYTGATFLTICISENVFILPS